MKQIPNVFTLLNLVFGFLAIVLIMQTGETLITVNEGQASINLPEKVYWGAVCIGLAAIIDFLDGFVARLFKATSDMGKQLDSLADIVSFGVAPGLIMYQLLRMSYVQQVNGLDVSMWALAPAVLIPCAGAFRLARYNIDINQQYGFKGAPIPSVGLVIASLPLIMWYDYFQMNELLLNKWFLYFLIIVLSYLMISRLPLMALKFRDYNLKNNMPKFILIIIAIISAALLKWLAVPVVFIFYIILSLLPISKTSGTINKTE